MGGGFVRGSVQDHQPEREALLFLRSELYDLSAPDYSAFASISARSTMLSVMFLFDATSSKCSSAWGQVVTRLGAPVSSAASRRRWATAAACSGNTAGKPPPAPEQRAPWWCGRISRTLRSRMNFHAWRGG